MKRILVIEDDDVERRFIAKALRDAGFDVVEAADGAAGIRLAQAELPDLVLSDVNVGDTSGLAVLEALRSSPRTSTVPVILTTGGEDNGKLRYGMAHGADDYLYKPFDCETVVSAVRARLERQRALELHAQEKEVRLLEILAASQDLVAIADAKTEHLLYLNRAGRNMLEIAPEEDVSVLRLRSFYDDSASGVSPNDSLHQARQQGVWIGAGTCVSRTGRRIEVSQQILTHRSPAGGVDYLSIVARDVTEQLRAEKDRRSMELQLRQAQKLEAIGQLAAGIAHEINTPTQYVGDNTRFLKDSFEDLQAVLQSHKDLLAAAKTNSLTPKQISQAEEVLADNDVDYLFQQIPAAIAETLEGVDRVSKIIRAMKEFSHPGSKEKALADVNKAVETTVTVARNEWRYVAEVTLDLDPALPPIPCFIAEINQVILNLVVNAAHAIADVVARKPGSTGMITISSRRDGDHVEVRVSDTGTGIPEAVRPKIFEPFFTTKEVGKGTGQGLSIVYGSVVNKHGGTVRFETETNKGTTFIIRLPIAPAVDSTPRKNTRPVMTSPAAGKIKKMTLKGCK